MHNPSELKSNKNISLLRQQMEAQAAAQQMAAQQAAATAAQQAAFSSCRSPGVKSEVPSPGPVVPERGAVAVNNSAVTSDEPHDLSVGGGRGREEEREREKQERERYYSQLMERYNLERNSPGHPTSPGHRERSEEREPEPRNHFDYRHLIPQVSIKTE